MTSDECLSFSDRFDTRQNALRPKRGLLLQRLLIHRLKNLVHCVGLGGLITEASDDFLLCQLLHKLRMVGQSNNSLKAEIRSRIGKTFSGCSNVDFDVFTSFKRRDFTGTL